MSRRPAINPLESFTHNCGSVAVREAVGNPKRFDPLLVGQHSDRAGPIGAPHAVAEAEGIEDAAERIPDVVIRERSVRQTSIPNPDRLHPANRPDKLTVPPQPLHAHASAPPLGRVRTELIPAERASAMTSAMALWLRGAMM